MPYTERSRANLLREGIAGERIYVTGNPIKEVLDYYAPQIKTSNALNTLGAEAGKYFLITLHRAENVDVPERLSNFIDAFHRIASEFNMVVICSLHPRTRSQLNKQNKTLDGSKVIALEPLGLFDFVNLEQNAFCVLSDSGTVQEECAIFKVPTVTLRDVTERPETLEVGSNYMAGCDPRAISRAVEAVTNQPSSWSAPPEYLVDNVSSTVMKIVLSYWR
jgi:UDP-N-acetylglucosamine 2-epimerase (non-hydrolysing)